MSSSSRQTTRHRHRLWAVVALAAVLSACAGDDASRAAGAHTDSGGADTEAGTDTGLGDARAADASPDADAPPKGPPYPIVLAHGMFGFDHLADLESVPYWHNLVAALAEHGEVVYVTEVDPLNDSYTRGAQLLEQVEAIVADSGYAKVNLIGHSQGGLDIRYVAHYRPDLVASAVGLAAPNGGTTVADIILELTDHQRFQDLVDALVRLIGQPLYDEAGEETSLFAPLRQFSQPGIEEFNARITDQPGVYYASVTGRTDGHRGGLICNTNDSADFVKKWRYDRDPVDPLFAVSEAVIAGRENHPNDGLVRVDQAMWGDFLGCIPADHLDQVGHLLGDDPGGDNRFDHVEFFVDLADYLHAQGL